MEQGLGWLQKEPHHHFNYGTTSGNWYSGRLNDKGIPVSMMADGTPKGYSFITFNGNKYIIDYQVVGKPKDHQIRISEPKVIGFDVKSSYSIYANLFMGHVTDEVSILIGKQGWQKLNSISQV